MAANRDIERARRYHDLTQHSPRSVSDSRHTLDWDNKPSPFKLYPELPVIPLPRDFTPPAGDTFEALSGPAAAECPLDIERLAALLYFCAGVTKQKTYPGGAQVFFRAAASTGALYQTEVYVIAARVAGLEAGVYHFGPGDFALRRLREGDVRTALAAAVNDDELAARPATIALTGIYWRNAWKYQARGYRHLFWDSGTMLANLTATASRLGVPARIALGFVDAEINALLGVDAAREGALALVPFGGPASPAAPATRVDPIAPAVASPSKTEVAYPLLVDAYADSSLESAAAVRGWRDGEPTAPQTPGAALQPLPRPLPRAGRALADAIQARGSTREFSGEPISAVELSSALYHATRGMDADVPSALVDLYLTIHAVDGIAPGAYIYHRGPHALELLRRGDVRAEAAFLALGQALGGLSSATVFFLADLGRALSRLGNRGYRAVNFEAGLIGGRLYLAAYAQRFGATGLTFYDADVVRFFSPHAAGKDAIFVTALGRSVRGTRP